MSREGSRDNAIAEQPEALEVIRVECSPATSSVNMNTPKITEKLICPMCEADCKCPEYNNIRTSTSLKAEEIENLLKEKEKQLEANYKERLENEIETLKDRANFILQNEQIRATLMLREAHRERQEKISALQTQLECKNLAALMYVMCSERRKSKLEKLRIIEEYTNYIRVLQDYLTESQMLILNLSRGFKTAARVDNEWRAKMTKVLTEFQMFVHDFAKGTPESDQFFFDLPKLLTTKTSTVDDPSEDPCEPEQRRIEETKKELEQEKPWYEKLDDTCHPFIVYGDLGDFKPDRRREVLRAVKNTKVVPRKWKQYMFNDMYVKESCPNLDAIKDECQNRLPPPPRWECEDERESYQLQSFRRRTTTASVDLRGNMGSILKLITSSNAPPEPKATLLGARDSMEIASTTKVREKHKTADRARVVLNIGARRASLFDETDYPLEEEEPEPDPSQSKPYKHAPPSRYCDDNTKHTSGTSVLGSIHNDSLTIMQPHMPDQRHKIRYEKICPMEKCQRLEMDSFMKTLPAYMRASPFTHFEQTFEEYDPCTPEQLEILRQRIERKKIKEKAELEKQDECPLQEWKTTLDGVGVQTSYQSSLSLPSCTCLGPTPSPVHSTGRVYDKEDLIPVKLALNRINKEFFYDNDIQFDRFKVIGQESKDTIKENSERKKNKLQEITKVLEEHPSLLEIFQGNTA